MEQTNRAKKVPSDIWKAAVNTWFIFFRFQFKTDPTFKGQQPDNLKSLVRLLEANTVSAGLLWDKQTVVDTLHQFLDKAWNHSDKRYREWIRKNFMINVLLSQYDKITTLNTYGEHHGTTFARFAGTVDTAAERITEEGGEPGSA